MFSRARCFSRRALTVVGAVAVVLVFASVAGAGSNFQNGNFETGDFTGWSVFQVGGGNWFVSNKTLTPIDQFSWKGPAEKEYAAVTDQFSAGTNILYQTIDVGSKTTKVSLIVYYKNRASPLLHPSDARLHRRVQPAVSNRHPSGRRSDRLNGELRCPEDPLQDEDD